MIPIGDAAGELDWWPGWAATGWLVVLALTSQVVGWLLISFSLPRRPAALTSVLLTAQPVASVVFAMLVLGESPSAVQLLGAATILAGLVIVSTGRRSRDPAPVAEAGRLSLHAPRASFSARRTHRWQIRFPSRVRKRG